MAEFFIGQKVVCVDDTFRTPEIAAVNRNLKAGSVYTISKLFTGEFGTLMVELCELPDTPEGVALRCRGIGQPGLRCTRFRPLEYKAMSIFRAIAANPNIKIRESA